MGKRVLVGYATKNGSTVGVAQKIGETLGAQGHSVDVKPMADRPSLAGYDAVVLGSADQRRPLATGGGQLRRVQSDRPRTGSGRRCSACTP